MINFLAGITISGVFFAGGILFQECKYKNYKNEIRVKELEKRIEELKLLAKNKNSNRELPLTVANK